MMLRFAFILALSFSGCFAYLDYDLEEIDKLWSRGVPAPGGTGSETVAAKCKKDLLLIVDTSRSIGYAFQNDVKPFLKSLVTDPILNVGEYGTQIALIIFSEESKTKILLKFGEIYEANQLEKYIGELRWDQVAGGHTRTDLALQLANEEIFTQINPRNNRPNVDDVIVLITDGEPRGTSDTLQKTLEYAGLLKDKKVLIVGAAIGPKRNNFIHNLRKMATSKDYVFMADFEKMDEIRETLVATSCIKPGECKCDQLISKPIYVKNGESTALVDWTIPQFSCKAGAKASVEDTTVDPTVTSPHRFSIGKHIINYTFHLKGEVTVTCPVTIIIKGELCRGKAFNSKFQVCCCGAVHERKTGYDCCGPDYYNTGDQRCCENDNLIPAKDSCP